MIMDYETLKLVWWLLIGILFIGFAIADGMDMVWATCCSSSARPMRKGAS